MRLEHAGGAAPTTLVGNIDESALGFSLDDPTGWPDGSVGHFVVTLDATTPDEERVLCLSRSGNAVIVDPTGRGWDDTAARPHSAGHGVIHSFSATEADDANAHVENTTTAHGLTIANVTTASNIQTLTGKTISGVDNTLSSIQKTSLPTDTTYLSTAQVLTNKDLSAGTNTLPNSVVTLTGAQALTNKNLAGTGNSFPATLIDTTSVQTMSSKTLTAPTISDFTNANHTHAGASTGGNIAQSAVTGLPTALTAKLDAAVIQAGAASVSFSAQSVFTQAVTFPTVFGTAPKVTVNIHSTGGPTARWVSRAGNITTTGFDIYVASPDASTQTWSAVSVQWIAVNA